MPTYLVGPGRAYTTIQAAFAVISAAGAGTHDVIVDAGTYTFASTFTTPSTLVRLVNVYAAVGSEWSGNPSTGVIINLAGFGATINSGTVLNNLVFINNDITITILPQAFAVNIFASGTGDGFTTTAGGFGGDGTCEKCLAVNTNNSNTKFSYAPQASNNNHFYNCGSYNFGNGFAVQTACDYVNCWAVPRAGGTCFTGSGTFSRCKNNASTDATAPGSSPIRNTTQTLMAFLNAAAYNFHILSTSVLRAAGTDLSSIFTTDIDGQAITVPWPIGPDALNAAAGIDINSAGYDHQLPGAGAGHLPRGARPV